uniref:Protein kinase domain-containing protein n=1 Tax=Panagrolaimus superbus TaxID=310955 RepID=A0A914ZAX8_9BILA
MYKQNPKGSVVRLLDKGMLADQNGEGMEFMVLEKAEIPVMDYVKGAKGLERKWRVSNVMLQMLKGIHDMHVQGLLHRDLKPDNMGILAKKQPIVVLFDLGMVRMYTGFFGEHRQPRTTCAFRGTPEWASGYAQKGRDQNRFDDLIGWLYVAVELFDETENPMQPLPWTFRQNPKIVKFLKSPFCPAYLLLRRCPPQFYAINTYLMTASRKTTPDYHFIANKVLETIADLENQMSKLPSSITTSSAAPGDNEKEKSKITGGGRGGDGGRPAAIRNIGTAGTTTGTGTTGGPSINEQQQKKSILKVSSDDQKKKSKSDEFKQNNNNNKEEAAKDSKDTKEVTKTKEQPSKEQKAVEEKKKSIQSDKSAVPENGGEKSGDKKAVVENKESLEKKDKSGNALPTKSRKSTASKNEIK